MRAKATALLSTSATVLADDPSLNVRWNQFPDDLKTEYAEDTVRQPIRIILDSKIEFNQTINYSIVIRQFGLWVQFHEICLYSLISVSKCYCQKTMILIY